MRKNFFLILMLLLVSPFSSGQSELNCPIPKNTDKEAPQRYSDFSSFVGWGKHFSLPHSAQIVIDPQNNQNRVMRFELREGDVFETRSGEHFRAEVYERYRAPFDVDMHYRFKVLIPNEWEYDDVRALIAQWHATPDRHLGEISRSPNLGIELRNDRFLIRSQTSQVPVNVHNKQGMIRRQLYLSELIEKNHWYQFDIKVNWTPNHSGYLQVTIDDKRAIDYEGATSYYDCVGPYFKAGIYRDNSPNTFIILFDDYERKRL
ncbi:polysaccharide lyase [Vibrio astriarenae]